MHRHPTRIVASSPRQAHRRQDRSRQIWCDWLLLTAILAGGLGSGGCVALGIPSERYADPLDHGGLFGDWRATTPSSPATVTEGLIQEGACLRCDCGSCEGLPMDLDPVTGCVKPPPPPPEVPWPRFHPVPTRPVFGPTRPVFGPPSGPL